jgi:hypothetical protein
MIRFSALGVFVLATAAAACSSSSSNETTFACAAYNTANSGNAPCTSCIASQCNPQASAELGSDWRSNDFAGGSCESYANCVAKCACGDNACFGTCVANDTPPACASDETAARSCIQENCATACGVPGATSTPDAG